MHLFTYGSLMFDPVWRRVVRGRYRSAPATLSGFRRWRVRGESYPGLWPGSDTDRVEGVLYFDIGAADLAALDRFEGTCYLRQVHDCVVGPAVEPAALYRIRPGSGHLLEAQPWDADWFAREGIAQFLQRYRGFMADDAGA